MSKEITRRELILRPINFARRNAGEIAVLTVLGGLGYALWQGSRNAEQTKNISSPIVQSYLENDLISEETTNLNLLRPSNQQEIVGIVKNESDKLWSNDRAVNGVSRWKIYSIVSDDLLGTHSRTSENDLKDPKAFERIYDSWGYANKFFDYLENTASKVDRGLVTKANPDQQANMWVEAILRAHSFISTTISTTKNPAQPDGVYVRTYLMLYGTIDDLHFVPLQNHDGR